MNLTEFARRLRAAFRDLCRLYCALAVSLAVHLVILGGFVVLDTAPMPKQPNQHSKKLKTKRRALTPITAPAPVMNFEE